MSPRTADDGTRAALLAAAGALAVAALAGCTAQQVPAAPGQQAAAPPGESAAPPVQAARPPNEGFFVSSNPDEGFKLAYGRDDSDDVRLMLQCQPGSGQIEIIDAGHPEGRAGQMLILTSGRTESALAPTLQTNEESGSVDVVAHAAPGLPALDGFRRSGDIGVKMGARSYALSATASEKVEIARFFSMCDRK